mmetsp:Transcript_13517/g.47678  ORF Transcript_13517/g.47678 Transcript_13517/m.47678 type:complete len:253 (-) Transcript_13517:3368-4126(-)
MTWLHFSSKTRSTFCTLTLAPCSCSRSVTRAEISSKRWSMERCSRAKCTALRHKLSTEAYFRRIGPIKEKRLSLLTWSSVNLVLCALTNSSNSCCISCMVLSRNESSRPRKVLSMACTSLAALAPRSSLVSRSIDASLSADIRSLMCFCTRASQNSCSCWAIKTWRIVLNCKRSVPHIESVCQTVRACSYHCESDAKEETLPAGASDSEDPAAAARLCFCEALARPIHWKTFSLSCKALSAYRFVGRDTCSP